MSDDNRIPHLVVVGGGAGGLEFAVRVAKKMGKRKIHITLVDESLKYIWKPLYHEVAAGTVNYSEDEINFITYAHRRHFTFVYGSLKGLDKSQKNILIAPVYDENNQLVIPERNLAYDYLVIAIGSVSNSFGIPGVAEHCLFLDKLQQAERFQRDFLYKMVAFIQTTNASLKVNIVGGGATGVELAAELKHAFSRVISLGAKSQQLIDKLEITILEGADRILPNLSPSISDSVTQELARRNIKVLVNQRVTKATPEGVESNGNLFLESDVTVWAAGIKGPDILSRLGLEFNAINQLVVKSTLQSVSADSIFALGDCAACPFLNKHGWVPPRAQAARQEAILLAKSFKQILKGGNPLEFNYRDYGSLVSLSRHDVVGNLMGKVVGSFFIEGQFARFTYWSLHKLHQVTVFGLWRVIMLSLSNLFTRRFKSGIKLH